MGKRIKMNEAMLKKMIKESVLGEVSKEKIMPYKYREMFISRVRNAVHGDIGDVEKAVKEFYYQFKDRIPNEDFTLDNLLDWADDIESDERSGGHGNPGADRQSFSDGWWGGNWGKFLEEGEEYKDAYSDNKGNVIQSRRDKNGKKHYRTVKKQEKTSDDGYRDAYMASDGTRIQSRRDEKGKKHYRTVKINESGLKKVILESVKMVLNEGLASPTLKAMAKKHGGIKSLDKTLQLDKLDLNFYENYSDCFIVTKDSPWDFPRALRKFINEKPIVTFKDGVSVYCLKPEYMDNEEVKSKIAAMKQSSEDLAAERNAGIEAGKGEDWDWEEDRGYRHYSYTIPPESMRQSKHKASRGKGKPEARGNDEDYDKYVENYLVKKYNAKVEVNYDMRGENPERIIIVPKPEGEIPFYYMESGPIADMVKDFEKYGYGWDERLTMLYSKSKKKSVYVFRKGIRVDQVEIDDKYMYPEYFMPVTSKVSAPKIGTQEFSQKISEGIRKALREMVEASDDDYESLRQKAQELYDEGIDWEKDIDDVDGGWANGYLYGNIEDEDGGVWRFAADAGFNWEGDWVPADIETVYFTAPNGQEGTL